MVMAVYPLLGTTRGEITEEFISKENVGLCYLAFLLIIGKLNI
jgi:hypothetical protein